MVRWQRRGRRKSVTAQRFEFRACSRERISKRFWDSRSCDYSAPTTATESWYGCPVTSPVKRRLALISQIEQTGSIAARNIAVAAQHHVMQHLTASQSWQSAADPFVKESEPPVRFTCAICNSLRQRKADLALQINIAVQQRASRSLLPPSLRNAGNALTIELVMTELGEVIYETKFAAVLPRATLTAAMPEMSQDLLRQLDAALAVKACN